MSDTLKDRDLQTTPAGQTPVAGHDAWFREQVEAGLKEAKDNPEACTPIEDVLKEHDL